MRVYSIYTQLLDELLKYSKKNDTASVKFKDLAALQDLEEKINNLYSRNYYSFAEYRILIDLCAQTKTTMREVIRVNNEVKALEKTIKKSRLKLA